MNSVQKSFQQKLLASGLLLGLIFALVLGMGTVKIFAQTHETSADAAVTSHVSEGDAGHSDAGVIKWAFLAAAISVGIGSIGAGAAVGYVGASAMGAIGEKPELAGRALIFVGLAEGIAIYGLIIAIMILGKV